MRKTTAILLLATLVLSATFCAAAVPEDNSSEFPFGDFSWMHGANYTPSYAATDVETWLNYDPAVVDRELGYAERIGLNCVRVFLQSLVYEHAPEKFLGNFADFVDRADSHGLKVMPILFDSCFGVSPSLESQHMWVANPGPDRMSEADFEALDAYVRAVVTPYVGDERIALWDVMNEPTVTVLSLTDEGRAQIWTFVRHYARLAHKLDSTHAITVGVAGTDSSKVIDLIDVLSCHSYAPTREKFREALATTQTQARQAGKPWIISECCAPGWGNRYEMVMPELREFNVGHTAWEVVIGKNQFAPISGLFYPDGSVRRASSIEAVAGKPVPNLTVKPDAEGMPIARQRAGRLAEYARFLARNEVSDLTWRERNTAVAALIVHGVYKPAAADVLKKLEDARTAHAEGQRDVAYRAVAELLRRAAGILTERDKAGAAKNEQARSIDLLNLGPWTNPFSEHPLFRAVVDEWNVTAEDDNAKQALTVSATLKRSTSHPLTVGADWSAAVPTDELRLDARNLGSHEVKIGVILVTKDGRRIASPFHVVEPGKGDTLIFDMLDAEPEQEPGHTAHVTRIEIAVRGMHARVPYRVSGGTLEFRRRPPLKPVTIEPTDLTGDAGTEVRLEWKSSAAKSLDRPIPVSLTVEKEKYVFLKATSRMVGTDDGVVLEPVSIKLPRGMPGGEYAIFADTRELPIAGQTSRRACVGHP